MAGMLLSIAIPLGVIGFCAWHEEYVARRRARAKIADMKVVHYRGGSAGLQLYSPDEADDVAGLAVP